MDSFDGRDLTAALPAAAAAQLRDDGFTVLAPERSAPDIAALATAYDAAVAAAEPRDIGAGARPFAFGTSSIAARPSIRSTSSSRCSRRVAR